MNAFPHLFSPARVGRLALSNRIVFAATSSELADHEGFVTEDMVEYYAERARGGAGLLVVEATYVAPEGKRLHHNAMLHDDLVGDVLGSRKFFEAIEEGTLAAIAL